MIIPDLPRNESSRLKALNQYEILDTIAEQEFDDLTQLASHICGTPISAVTLVDQDRQWFKSIIGLEVMETPREFSFCAHAILDDRLLVVPDATADPRFASNPFIVGEPHLRFYAGAPLITPDGLAVGALCVLDTQPRQLSQQQLDALQRLGRQAVALLESRLDANRLRASEARYRQLFETSQDGILLINSSSGQIEDANQALCALLGYNRESFLSHRINELDSFREITSDQLNLMALKEGGTARTEDVELVTQSGSRICVEMVGNLTREGEKTLIQWNIRDITSRKQDEARLRESEEHLRSVIEASNDGIWEWDLATDVVKWSEQIYSNLGLSPTDFVPTFASQLTLVHPDDVELLRHATEKHMADGEPFHLRVRYRHKDGHYLQILARGQLQRDSKNQPLRMIGSFSDLTPLLQMEAEREEKSREILAIWESMTDAFFNLDTDWNFTHVNQRACEIWGKEAEELIGHSIWDVFPGIVGSDFHKQYLEAMKTQIPVEFEACYPPGHAWREVHAYPSPSGLSVYFRDINERKQTEEALSRSESMFRTLITSSWDGFHLVAPTGEILYESPACKRMLGYLPEEMVGHNALEFVHPDDFHFLTEDVTHQLEEPGSMRIVQLRIRHKDGSWRWVESCDVNLLQHPDVGAFAVNYRDITERKHAEEERDRFFTTSLDMLGVVGMDGYLKRVNPAFSSILGFTEAELLSFPYIELVHPDDLQMSMAVAADLNLGVPLAGFENRFRRKDGSWCWLEWRAVAFPEEGLIYAAARDITQRKADEVILHQVNEELENRVAGRTAELAVANRSLQVENLEHRVTMASLEQMASAYRMAQQTAEAASMAKSDFMSRMSHELRTPLNAILGFGQILQSADLKREEMEQVGQILNGGWHLLDLINEILDISRVEAGNLELSPEVVPLIEILAESCSLVTPLAAQRKVLVDCASARGPEQFIFADRQRVKQVLINLISNGIKYNRENGRVSFIVDTGKSDKIRLGVRDTGFGLSKEDQSKLFVAFERLGASEAGIDGTGLGLMLSKHLVTSMGGQLEVESTVGTGSTFWVELPLATQIPETSTPQESDAPPAPALQQAPDSYQVLSIEDDISNQRLVQQLLSSRPEIAFRGAPSGEAGLRLASQLQPDLILVNLNLPDMPGSEVLQRLRENQSTQQIPVIIVSAEARQPHIEATMAAGVVAYLTKPYTVTEIMLAIDGALSAAAPISKGVGVERRHLRVLVAEDNAINQRVIAHQLTKMGHEVVVCADGQTVVETWKSSEFDLILMDCRMPTLDGYEATAEIRRLENGQGHVPIIALTANALLEDREKSLVAGMDDHLSKPITQAELAAALQRWGG